MPPRGWKSGREDTVNIGTRLPVSLVERMERYYEHMQDERPYVRFTRGDAYREIIATGLTVLEDKTTPPSPRLFTTPMQVTAESPEIPMLREVPWDITQIDEAAQPQEPPSPSQQTFPPPTPHLSPQRAKHAQRAYTTRPIQGESLPDKVRTYLEQYGESRGRYTVEQLWDVLDTGGTEKRRLRTALQRLAGVAKNSKPRSFTVAGEAHVLVQVEDIPNEYSLQPRETM